MLDNKLIENALALCGKTIEDMNEVYVENHKFYRDVCVRFSIEKFCYYLLSHEFLERYDEGKSYVFMFGDAICDYQSGNEEHLIKLLSKICTQDKKESISS